MAFSKAASKLAEKKHVLTFYFTPSHHPHPSHHNPHPRNLLHLHPLSFSFPFLSPIPLSFASLRPPQQHSQNFLEVA